MFKKDYFSGLMTYVKDIDSVGIDKELSLEFCNESFALHIFAPYGMNLSHSLNTTYLFICV